MEETKAEAMEETESTTDSETSTSKQTKPSQTEARAQTNEGRTVDEEVATLAMSTLRTTSGNRTSLLTCAIAGDRERRIHDAVRHLQAHYSLDAIAKAVALLHKIVSNIISHPADAKFRSIRKANRLFDGQVAPFPEALEFLLALGFEDQSDKFVLVREDPALLWIGRSTLEVLLPAA
ncbi:hypothetical protein PHMEG_00039243 [Phytophthora megakarya]|uniref:PUB domain-containing protein n=1 Tax=Phytophthora megakarya TaxID=4795 RepID=A0A225UFY6_9STRA|nr:hypothetical protein PHMEG_00039243 [Phytophthora megakarya]